MHESWPWSIADEIDFDSKNAERDFYLQFTTLFWDTESREWHFGCLLDEQCTQKIYSIDVDYNTVMDVKLKAWKNQWDDMWVTSPRNKKPDEITLSSLFDDFIPQSYKGEVWMR
jgi:hypothetical protein